MLKYLNKIFATHLQAIFLLVLPQYVFEHNDMLLFTHIFYVFSNYEP